MLVYFYGQKELAFFGSALHFIRITWFIYVFANICKGLKWVQFVFAAQT